MSEISEKICPNCKTWSSYSVEERNCVNCGSLLDKNEIIFEVKEKKRFDSSFSKATTFP